MGLTPATGSEIDSSGEVLSVLFCAGAVCEPF